MLTPARRIKLPELPTANVRVPPAPAVRSERVRQLASRLKLADSGLSALRRTCGQFRHSFRDWLTLRKRPVADIRNVSNLVGMVRTWPDMRYWCALAASLCLAVLVIPGGLAMGGPNGAAGWATLAILLAAPITIWWTRHRGKASAFVQYGYLLLFALALGSAALAGLRA